MPLAQHQFSVGAALGRRVAAGAVVAGLGLAMALPSAVPQARPAPDPHVLTERFPLDAGETAPRSPAPPATSEPAAPSRQATPPAPAAEPSGDSSGGSMMVVVAIIAGVVLLAAGLVGGRALRRRWLRNSEPPIPPWRGSRRAPDGRAGVAAMEARFRPRTRDPGSDAVNARISPPEVPPVSQPDVTPTPPPPAPPAPAAPVAPAAAVAATHPGGEAAPPEPAPPAAEPAPATAAAPAPPPDITLVEAVPGGPSPRPRVHDQDGGPPLPDIVLIGTPNGAGGRTEALPGLGDDPEPSGTPSLDELPDITLVEPPPPAAAPPPATPEPRPRRDPGSDALAARIRPDEARLDAAARALRSRVPPREESERPEEFWSARERAQTELQAAAAAAGEASPPPETEGDSAARSEPAPSLPAAVREIATPRHPPAAAAVPVAVIHGFRSALRALREGPREEERDPDE